jgi:hypothetical protein
VTVVSEEASSLNGAHSWEHCANGRGRVPHVIVLHTLAEPNKYRPTEYPFPQILRMGSAPGTVPHCAQFASARFAFASSRFASVAASFASTSTDLESARFAPVSSKFASAGHGASTRLISQEFGQHYRSILEPLAAFTPRERLSRLAPPSSGKTPATRRSVSVHRRSASTSSSAAAPGCFSFASAK